MIYLHPTLKLVDGVALAISVNGRVKVTPGGHPYIKPNRLSAMQRLINDLRKVK